MAIDEVYEVDMHWAVSCDNEVEVGVFVKEGGHYIDQDISAFDVNLSSYNDYIDLSLWTYLLSVRSKLLS